MASDSETQSLVETEQPLTPSGGVRFMAFWAPTVAAVAGLLCWPYFSRLSPFAQAPVISLAALSTLIISSFYAAAWQLKPLPTEAAIQALGGRRFRRPSDGKFMEYWVSGQPGAKNAVVFCHRMDGRLGCEYGKARVEAVLREKNACLVSPSIPMLSASPPYDTDLPVQWLEQWTQDLMHLLSELGAENVYVIGLSWGAQLCLNLAMACQKKGSLRGVAQIGGCYWDTKLVEYKNGVEAGGAGAKAFFSKPALMRPLAYLLVRPFVEKMGEATMLPENELSHLRRHFGDDLTTFQESMVRSMTFFLHQNWQVARLSACPEADQYVDLAKFNPAIPIHVHLGKDDKMANEQQQQFLDQVNHATLILFEGSHTGFPLAGIIRNLFDAHA